MESHPLGSYDVGVVGDRLVSCVDDFNVSELVHHVHVLDSAVMFGLKWQ